MQDEARLRELVRLKVYRKQNERIRYFQPNGGQLRFLEEISRPEAFIVMNGSGNGAGKSYGLIATFAAFMWPQLAAPCFSAPIFQDWQYPKRARLCSTPKELEEIGSLQTAIQELFPKGRYEASKKGKSFPSQFKSDTGWVLDLFSYEQDKSEMAGPTLGLLGWNEPMPEDLWKEGLSRMRKGGLILGAMTSLADEPWVVDGILSKHNGKDFRVIYSDIETNCKQHSPNGTLEHDQIEKILSQYDPDEREARKTGKPLSLSGRVYKSFDRDVHVSKTELIPPKEGVSFYSAIDPASGKPLAAVFAWVNSVGDVYIYDEYPETPFHGAKDPGLNPKQYVELFKAKEHGKEFTRILDRHFGNQTRVMGGLTLKQEFGELGFDCIDSYRVGENLPEVETGIFKVRDYLAYDKTRKIDALNKPKLTISPTCLNTIASFEKWMRDPDTGKPKEQFKDHADCVRYLLSANPEFEKKREWGTGQTAYYGVG